MIWLLIEIDIPRLSSDGIEFGDYCFVYTYSIQSSSTLSLISSSFDATDLELAIRRRSSYCWFPFPVPMSLESQESLYDNTVSLFQDYLNMEETYDSDICSKMPISPSSSIHTDRITQSASFASIVS